MTTKHRYPTLPREELELLKCQHAARAAGPNAWESSIAAVNIRASFPGCEASNNSGDQLTQGAGSPREPGLSGDTANSPTPNLSDSLVKLDHRRRGSKGCGASNTATPSQVRDTTGRISIDWLTVHQFHPNAPKVGSDLLLFCDLETGEIRSESVRGLQHRGSHDSSLQIRCDGRRVEVSGNPSKWGRFDNVFGHPTLADCLELYNGILRSLDLPEFSEEDRSYVLPFRFQKSDSVAPSGAVITRVDLCRNWSAGGASHARSVVAALSSVVRMGKCGWLSPDGNTVAWGIGSRYVYSKYYLKGPELRKHPGSDPEYNAQLADWCDSVGLVRQEVSLKSMLLKRNGLDRPGAWTREAAESLMDEYSQHKECGASCASYDELFQVLRASGVPMSRARAAQTALQAYLNGFRFVIGENISRSAFYRLRSDVRASGVDIAAPLNVATLPVRIRELTLNPADAPAWYRWAG